MKRIYSIIGVGAVAVLVAAGCDRSPSNTGQNQGSTSTAQSENVTQNVPGSSGAMSTAQDQGSSDADREATRRIRQAIEAKDGLSTDAKNIKIITQNGKVTLRGEVKDQQEDQTIKSIVQNMGFASLDDQLQVKPPNQ
jgi:hyperosmotically inducible periplasmic protein